MSDQLIYASRLVRLPLVDSDGTEIGRVVDVVVGTLSGHESPRVHGFVVTVERRRVFVSANRISEIDERGARLRLRAINMRQFTLRVSEMLLVGEVLGREVQGARVVDISIRSASGSSYSWEVATVALGGRGLLARRRVHQIVDWDEVASLFSDDRPVVRQAAAIGMLHPVDMAAAIRKLPLERRRALAEVLEDERLADLLEELSEDEQIRIVEGLDLERVASVLDEMDADDAADLLNVMPLVRREELLGAMTPDEADPVRRLLAYGSRTAGGIMTPEPLIMPPTSTVAEALARIRDPDISAALAAQVFVTAAPNETPSGRYLGVAGYQRLLREAPSKQLVRCLDKEFEPVSPDTSERDVAVRVAAYDAMAVPVVDAAGRLLGAVTVDDVLDHVLPANWRHG